FSENHPAWHCGKCRSSFLKVPVPQVSPPQPPGKVPQFPPVPQVSPPWSPGKVSQFPPDSPPWTPGKVPLFPPDSPPWTPGKVPQFPPDSPPQPPVKVPQFPPVPGVSPPQPPVKVPQFPPLSPPWPPVKVPPFPQVPGVLPPQPPGRVPQYPPLPQVPLPQPPGRVPQYPQVPQVSPPQPPGRVPQYPQVPQVSPPQPPGRVPQYPQVPLVSPPQPPGRVPQYPQVPLVSPPKPPGKVPQVPQVPSPLNSCDVDENQKVPCGSPTIDSTKCSAISCCFDGHRCYFGKAVTVQCTKDAQFIVVVAKDATLPRLELESVALLGTGPHCTYADSNSDFAIYQFPVTSCGSTVKEESGVIIYENSMSSTYEVGVGHLGAITRDSHYQLNFQCRYHGTSVETVIAEVLPLHDPPPLVSALGPLTVELRLGNGQCQSKGCNEVDVAYNSFYTEADYPVTKVLRDPVYVEVQLMGKTDPNLVLTLGRCWTTTSPSPHTLPQWDILIDGCPYRDDRYLSSLVPVTPSSHVVYTSHFRRFIFKMFTFVDPSSLQPLKEQVYIHCSTAVCTPAPGRSCEPACFRKKRHVKAEDPDDAEPNVVVSSGLVIMNAPEEQTV
uniref:Zona pellucida sperm-binding protein 4 n=1 Tax=Monopterus albus TaxID=43700 RepID=A0A3Q3ILR0_MONAL